MCGSACWNNKLSEWGQMKLIALGPKPEKSERAPKTMKLVW